jgi:hypothetical protein
MYLKKFKYVLVTLLLFGLVSTAAHAQAVTSNVSTISLSATVNESVTVSCDTSALVITVNPAPFHCTITWNLSSGHNSIVGALYFGNANALTSAGGSIPASAVIFTGPSGSGSCGSNGTYGGTSLVGSCGGNTGFFNVALTSANLAGNTTSPLSLAVPTLNNFPPGNYSGTAFAQVFVL